MDRRTMLGAVGAAAGLASLGTSARADDEPHAHHAMKNKAHEECMKACIACEVACNEMAHHCLAMLAEGKGDLKHHAKAHQLAMDCAAFCTLSMTMMSRMSPLMAYSCGACAEACKACAAECDKSASTMPIMKACADKCRECETSCLAMVKSMKEHVH